MPRKPRNSRYTPLVTLMALIALVATALMVGCASSVGSGQASIATAPAAPTVAPTATPTTAPMSPVEALLAVRTQQAIGALGQRVAASYDAQKQTATVTVTAPGKVPLTDAQVAAAHALVMQICYFAEPALWSSGVALREVTLIVLGPMLDEYDDIISNWSGIAIVEASTAQRIDWASLSPQAAWNLYDQHLLRDSYDIFD